jgi:hypothetical protein
LLLRVVVVEQQVQAVLVVFAVDRLIQYPEARQFLFLLVMAALVEMLIQHPM